MAVISNRTDWQQLKRENAVGSHYSSPGGKCSRYFETKIPAEAVMLHSEKKIIIDV